MLHIFRLQGLKGRQLRKGRGDPHGVQSFTLSSRFHICFAEGIFSMTLEKLYPKVNFLWQRFILHFNFGDFVYLFLQNKEHWTLNLNFFCTFLGNENFLLSFNPHFSVKIKWYICIKHTKIMNMLLAAPLTIKLIIVLKPLIGLYIVFKEKNSKSICCMFQCSRSYLNYCNTFRFVLRSYSNMLYLYILLENILLILKWNFYKCTL